MTAKEQTALYRKYCRRLYNTSFRILSDTLEAEDVMQETLLKYMLSRPRVKNDAQESAWLTRTCIRASLDIIRKRKRSQAFLEDYAHVLEMEDGGPADIDMAGLSVSEVVSQIQEMPETDRVILDLILIEGAGYAEVAELLGCTEGALRVRLFRAKRQLAERMLNLNK